MNTKQNNVIYDVVIVGAGASGVMCAIRASQRGKRVLLIDGDLYPAKKLMVTGNGKCNLTNINMASKYFNQNIDDYLSRFDERRTLSFFNDLGLVTYTDEEGRVYPYFRTAKSVIDILNNKLQKNQIEFKMSEVVEDINKCHDHYTILTSKSEYLSKSVVLSTGSFVESNIISKFDIALKTFNPSLCALKCESFKRLSGVRLSDVEVTAICNGKSKADRGEVLFKDEGLSGIVIFNLSSLFARAGIYKGKIIINLMPDFSREEIVKMLHSRMGENDIFKGWFHDEVASIILKKSGVLKINKSNIDKIVDAIIHLEFSIDGYYPNNQVHSGGVLLSSLTNNLESKEYKGLYFCGEIVDVDGECGGYNLQWAWTSGAIVGDCV